MSSQSLNLLAVNQTQQKRLSRKLTVDTQAPYFSVRPVIKKADKEAAYTLTEAYKDDITLQWITGTKKDEAKRTEFYLDMFKHMIRSAAHVSRELAVQVNGCKGVLLWSVNNKNPLTAGNIFSNRSVWTTMRDMLRMRASAVHHRQFVKAKKSIMDERPHLVIYYVGVLPSDRRQHLGTALVNHVLSKADTAQLPVFIELWGDTLLPWFQKLGFEVCDTRQISSDTPTIYYAVREPRIPPSTPLSPQIPSSPTQNLQLLPPREDGIQASTTS